jgi:hypothetical protein
MRNVDEKTIRTAIAGLTIDRLLAAVPQSDLLPALGLVPKHELAQMMGINYSTMRWLVGKGRIPRPTIRLNRRAYYARDEAEAIVKAWKNKY